MSQKTFRLIRMAAAGILLLGLCLCLPGRHVQAWNLQLSEDMTQVHDGTLGKDYYAPVYMANGAAPYSYQLAAGSLPPGLSFPKSSADGYAYISGKPVETGTYSFTLQITDSKNNRCYCEFTIRIAGQYDHFNVDVGNGEARNLYGHAAHTFQAGEWISLSCEGYAPKGKCLDHWVVPKSVDLNLDNGFYMPAENIYVEAAFQEIHKGFLTYADLNPYRNGGPYAFSEYEENTLDLLFQAGLVNRRVEYGSNYYDWYSESINSYYYDIDKDGTDDMQLIRVSQSTGSVMRYGGSILPNSLPTDIYTITVPDELMASATVPLYEVLVYDFGHHLKSVGFRYPTCTVPGVKAHYVCTDCGALYWDAKGRESISGPAEVELAAYGHSMTHVSGTKPTCTEGGLVEHYECSECHQWFYDQEGKNIISDHSAVNLPASGHAFTHVGGLKPTCTEDGIVEHYECSVCKEWFWDEEAKHPVTDKNAVTLKATGHSLSKVESKAVSCTEDGNSEYYVCSNCHEWFKDAAGKNLITDHGSVLIKSGGHDMSMVDFHYPTCTEDGVKEHYVCGSCGGWFWDKEGTDPVTDHAETVLPALGHDMSMIDFHYPTCTEDGVKEHYICDNCGEWFWDKEGENLITDHSEVVLPALGHDMTNVTFHYPTCTEDGVKEHYVCGNCDEWFWDKEGENLITDHSETVLPALGHDMTMVEFHYPTCTEDGVKEHYVCGNCEEWFWDQEGQYPIADHAETELESYGHDMTMVEFHYPTCLEDGVKEHYICGNCQEWFWDQEGENLITDHSEVVLPAYGHSMIPISSRDASCTEAGVIEHYECSECDEWFWDAEGMNPIADRSDVIREALGHSWGEWKVLQEATAKEAGLAERICLHDVTHRETKEIPPIGGETLPEIEKNLKILTRMLTIPANGQGYVSGEEISYQVIVENNGTETLYDVVVKDEASGKEWVVRTLAPGEKEVFTVDHVMTASDVESGSFVYVPPTETDPVPPETSPVPEETTKASELPTSAPTQAAAETTAAPKETEKDKKDGKDSSGVPAWVLIPAVGLGGLSAGLIVTLVAKNKALAAATGAAAKAASGAAEAAAESAAPSEAKASEAKGKKKEE